MKQEDILTITAQSVQMGHSLRQERDTLVNFGTKGMAIGGGVAFGANVISGISVNKMIETLRPETPPQITFGMSLAISTISFFSTLICVYKGIKDHIQKFDNYRSQKTSTK